jgi:hypothetical protein
MPECARDNCCWEEPVYENGETPRDAYCDPKTGELVYPDKELDFPDSHLNTARTNKFLLVIHTPKCLADRFKIDRFLIGLQKTNIPPINIPSINKPYAGGNFKTSSMGREPYSSLRATFKVDTSWTRYKFIYDWLNTFSDSEQGFIKTPNSMALYTKSELITFNEQEIPVAKWDFDLLFPTSLSEIQMEWTDDPKEITCDVTFDYSILNFQLLESNY